MFIHPVFFVHTSAQPLLSNHQAEVNFMKFLQPKYEPHKNKDEFHIVKDCYKNKNEFHIVKDCSRDNCINFFVPDFYAFISRIV